MRRLSALLLSILFAVSFVSCTSKESKEDSISAEDTAAVDSEIASADESEIPVDETSAGFVDEQLPEQALGEAPAPIEDTAVAQQADPSEATIDTLAAEAEPAPVATEQTKTDIAAAAPPAEMQQAPTQMDNGQVVAGVDLGATPTEQKIEAPAPEVKAPVVAEAPRKSKALEKAKTTPYREGDLLLNAYYVARPGDNFRKIARTIFGDTKKSKELKAGNPEMSVINVGDKIYYNSPVRPTDESAMKNFYEDSGLSAELYVAKEGDNLRKVAKKLMGFDQAWKEIWSTNQQLESRGALVAGTEIRFWNPITKAAEEKPTTLAMNTPPPAPAEIPASIPPSSEMPVDPQPAPVAAAEQLPPPVEEVAQAEIPPPPAMDPAAAATTVAEIPPPPPPAEMPPPPPPPVEAAPPPPPPPPMPHAKANEPVVADGSSSNDDMMMMLGAGGILAAGLAALMIIRKRRQQKEAQTAFQDSQIGAS